jgi:hypothetical protein
MRGDGAEFGKDSGGISSRLIAHLSEWLLVSLGAVSTLNAERPARLLAGTAEGDRLFFAWRSLLPPTTPSS